MYLPNTGPFQAPVSLPFPFGLLLAVLLLFWPYPSQGARPLPAAGVATAHPLATEAGIAVLEAGGNAFDVAVAVSAALAVVEPYSSGLGGGGFWLLHRAADGRQVMVDGREKAPLAAHRDMYLDEAGEVVPGASVDGPLSAAIPGLPAALAHIARRYGRLSLSESLAPAIRLARQGFSVTPHYRRMASFRLTALGQSPAASVIFSTMAQFQPLGTWFGSRIWPAPLRPSPAMDGTVSTTDLSQPS